MLIVLVIVAASWMAFLALTLALVRAGARADEVRPMPAARVRPWPRRAAHPGRRLRA